MIRRGHCLTCKPCVQDEVRYNWDDPQSLNRYVYVNGRPMALTDPSGLDSCHGGSGGEQSSNFYNPIDVISCIAQHVGDWFGFGGGQFHGSLKPRPSAGAWNDSSGVPYPGLGSAINQVLGGSYSSGGCEFGPCGSLATPDSIASGGGANALLLDLNPLATIFAFQNPHGSVAAACRQVCRIAYGGCLTNARLAKGAKDMVSTVAGIGDGFFGGLVTGATNDGARDIPGAMEKQCLLKFAACISSSTCQAGQTGTVNVGK
jgi:hypothetical protein